MYACPPPRPPSTRPETQLAARKSACDEAWRLTDYPQVLRWSALGTGVFYGAYHQLSLSARDKMTAQKKEWEHKESLIRQAKQEWARTHPAQQPKSSGAFAL
jgi:F-type H+-transporting ATP synthase subunit e